MVTVDQIASFPKFEDDLSSTFFYWSKAEISNITLGLIKESWIQNVFEFEHKAKPYRYY